MKGELMPKKGTDRGMRRWRAATLLAVGAVIGMVMVATPAGAHVGGTVNHLWGHLKPKADARYVNAVSGTDKAAVADQLSKVTIVRSEWTTMPANGELGVEVTCPAGTVAVGGGAWSFAGTPDPYVNTSYPETATRWQIYIYNPTASTTLQARAYVVCIGAASSIYPVGRVVNRADRR
jgi:hypothetical protein